MDECSIVCVPEELISQLWPVAAPFIKRAYESGIGDDPFEETERKVLSGLALSWIIHDKNGAIASLVTEIINTPNKRLCVIVALGGREMHRWKHLISTIEEYAAAKKCDAVRIYGRNGWERVYPQYKRPWVALERKL